MSDRVRHRTPTGGSSGWPLVSTASLAMPWDRAVQAKADTTPPYWAFFRISDRVDRAIKILRYGPISPLKAPLAPAMGQKS